jgi:hypothetical protein
MQETCRAVNCKSDARDSRMLLLGHSRRGRTDEQAHTDRGWTITTSGYPLSLSQAR